MAAALRGRIGLRPLQELEQFLGLDTVGHAGGVQDDVGVTGDRPGAITGAIHDGGGQLIGEGIGEIGHGSFHAGAIGGDGLAGLVDHLGEGHAVGDGVGQFDIADGVGGVDDAAATPALPLPPRPLPGHWTDWAPPAFQSGLKEVRALVKISVVPEPSERWTVVMAASGR